MARLDGVRSSAGQPIPRGSRIVQRAMSILGEQEHHVLSLLDSLVQRESAKSVIDPIVARVEEKLGCDPAALLAWEPVPLTAYGCAFPDLIRSSWVFVLRGGATTGAERHPNSHQRVMSYRGHGD